MCDRGARSPEAPTDPAPPESEGDEQPETPEPFPDAEFTPVEETPAAAQPAATDDSEVIEVEFDAETTDTPTEPPQVKRVQVSNQMDILAELGIRPKVIRAGRANMFLSPVFADAVTGTTGVSVELYETDGAEGAARGAAVGTGYVTMKEAFSRLELEATIDPNPEHQSQYEDAYAHWLAQL